MLECNRDSHIDFHYYDRCSHSLSIGGTTLIYILMTNPQNITVMPIRMFSGINSFTLMALPLFVLAARS